MRRSFVIALGAAVLFSASPALACRQLIPSAKFEHSDIVVDGEAKCLATPGKCRLTIAAVRKGSQALAGETIEISVDEAPPRTDSSENELEIRRCPQTFEPWKAHVSGRFYLRRLPEGVCLRLIQWMPPND